MTMSLNMTCFFMASLSNIIIVQGLFSHGKAQESICDSVLLNSELISQYVQGVPKKTLFSGILAITPLWKVLELKLGGVSKTSGNSLCDRHKNFPN